MKEKRVNKPEFDEIILGVQNEGNGTPEKTLVLSLIFKIYDFMEEHSSKDEEYAFGDIIRICANNIPFTEESQKALCKRAAGKYFGSHGGRKSAKVRKKEIPPNKKKSKKNFIKGKGGQLEFIM